MKVHGGSLLPVGDIARQKLASMPEGQRVTVELDWSRSRASHNHHFAEVEAYWQSIPERHMGQPWAASADHLRKHCLIATGYCDTYQVDAGSNAAALRIIPHLQAAEVGKHGYAIVQVSGPVIRVWTPRSQSMRAMGNKDFQASKQAVLDHLETMFAELAA